MQIIFLQERVRCLNLSQHHPIQNQKLIKHPHRTKLKQKNINIDLHGEQIDSKRTIEVLIKVIETYQTRMDDLLNVIEVLKNENTDLKEQLQKPNVS